MRRIVHGGTEHYTIAVNYRQVNGMLVIDDIDHFDIIDGYHRYLALSRINKEDKNFDFNMELRIVCFTEEKAKQFIWQEDQKTKMARIDSDALNQYNPANQIIGNGKMLLDTS